MSEIPCTRCMAPISKPFSVQIFTGDGQEYEVDDKIPDGFIDGHGSVMVYMHRDCKSSSSIYARIRAKSGSYTKRNVASSPRAPSSAADKLAEMGFSVASFGHRFLMVLPGNTGSIKGFNK